MIGRIKNFIIDKTKNPKLIITLLLLAIVLGFLLFSNYGLYTRLKLQNQKIGLKQKIKDEEKIHDSLKHEIYELKNNNTEIERVAREKYGMLKPGEKVFLIEHKKEK
ncbi:MAG: septum formation initiator family protein [Bacteroidetes bacterium]|nr:septum formation initiator family protein [Patescibacteria group bacterium]MCL5990837.1 septum formation initiator family protein [Bacteroidota bacterium]